MLQQLVNIHHIIVILNEKIFFEVTSHDIQSDFK